MEDTIEPDLPPPPATQEPTVEDAFTAVAGVMLPKTAKKYKVIFSFVGLLEVLLGIYLCLFGIVTSGVAATYDHKNVWNYAALCGAGVLLLVSGGLKKSRYNNQCVMITNMSLSFVALLIVGAIASVHIWFFVTDPTQRLDILPVIVAAICLAIGIICGVHFGCYWAGSQVSMEPIHAIMYTNVHTGDQFFEYQNVKKDKKKREKRRSESFKSVKREVLPGNVSSPPSILKKDKRQNIPMAPMVRSGQNARPRN